MAEKDREVNRQVPPPPRQPDEILKGYIERDNQPADAADSKDGPAQAR